MKPVDSYSAINTRLDRPASSAGAAITGNRTPDTAASKGPGAATQLESAAAAEGTKPAVDTAKANGPHLISTTVSQLATEKPPFDAQKVADIKQQIASGVYKVDTDALAAKMLDAGVLGVDSKK